ncbi:MAG: bile acid:sodium symporter [Opitutaceae bacterium]|nr:bile acid:sodium symporter [Opitutaceae bacterium]
MTAKRKRDWFTPAMLLAVALAWVFPRLGAGDGPLPVALLVKLGVALIFFLYGLTLSFAALRAGALHWRLHLLVQGMTFLVLPLLGLAIAAVTAGRIPADLRLGIVFLSVLPSTVSSAVALTAAAGGNVAGAVFNATASSLLGIVLTPLWLGFYLETGGDAGPILPVILNLVCWLLLPMAAGQLCRLRLADWAARHKPRLQVADRLVILMIIYTSFCDSVQQGIWQGRGAGELLLVLGLTALLLVLALGLVDRGGRWLGFAPGDRAAALFCGSQKSLAVGAPMAGLLFAGQPVLGSVLLPVMIYHMLQLLVAGCLAARWKYAGSEGNENSRC